LLLNTVLFYSAFSGYLEELVAIFHFKKVAIHQLGFLNLNFFYGPNGQ